MLALTSVHPCLHPLPKPTVPAAVEMPFRENFHNALHQQSVMAAQCCAPGCCHGPPQLPPHHLQGKNAPQVCPYHSSRQGVAPVMTSYRPTPTSPPDVAHQLPMFAHIQHAPRVVGPSLVDRGGFLFGAQVYHVGPAPRAHPILPPFSMFSSMLTSSLVKGSSRSLVSSEKSGFEFSAATSNGLNRIPQKHGLHSSFADFSNSSKQTGSVKKLRRKRFKKREVLTLEVHNRAASNDLSHSIASILSEGSEIPENRKNTIVTQTFTHRDGRARNRKMSSEAYNSDVQSDVDVTSCSSDELECESKAGEHTDENEHFKTEPGGDVTTNPADERSIAHKEGCQYQAPSSGEHFSECTQLSSAITSQGFKVHTQQSQLREQWTAESQSFVKEEIHCDIEPGVAEASVSDNNVHPESPSSAVSSNEISAPVRKVCPHLGDRLGVQERSAFKPISKHCSDTPLMCGSFPPQQLVYGGRAACPCVTCSDATFRNFQTNPQGCSELEIKEHVIELDFDDVSSADGAGASAHGAEATTDAISTLRHKSCIYQNKVVVDQSQGACAPALAETLGAWFDWLRGKDTKLPTSEALPARLPPPPRYFCEACSKTYSTFGGLSKHRQFHCPEHVRKEFACKLCNKSYSSLGALKMHIRTHTLPCKCQVCGKAFSRPWLLQGHVRTHTGEKPFRCSHCGRAFADRSNLRAHLQTHADVKKYACKNCGKTFSRMSLLSKHSEGSCPRNSKV